jgi:hypothetical protein
VEVGRRGEVLSRYLGKKRVWMTWERELAVERLVGWAGLVSGGWGVPMLGLRTQLEQDHDARSNPVASALPWGKRGRIELLDTGGSLVVVSLEAEPGSLEIRRQ